MYKVKRINLFDSGYTRQAKEYVHDTCSKSLPQTKAIRVPRVVHANSTSQTSMAGQMGKLRNDNNCPVYIMPPR